MLFHDRKDAGRRLARALMQYRGMNAVVYALPRGGAVLGALISKALNVPLDLIITRKIGHPTMPEYAVCAITADGELLCNEEERSGLDPSWLAAEVDAQRKEAQRRRKTYLGEKKHISAAGKIAIIVDDGVATGLTILSAIRAVRKEIPKEIVVAAPVAPYDVVETLRIEVDSVILLEEARRFLGAVGAYYEEFPQVSDEEVIELLSEPRQRPV